jgi:hypothetical protein
MIPGRIYDYGDLCPPNCPNKTGAVYGDWKLPVDTTPCVAGFTGFQKNRENISAPFWCDVPYLN